jgi:voltage-gated potassium channel Kch
MSCVFSSLFIFLFLVCVFPALEFRFLRYFEVHFPRVSSSFLFSFWVGFFGFLDSSQQFLMSVVVLAQLSLLRVLVVETFCCCHFGCCRCFEEVEKSNCL